MLIIAQFRTNPTIWIDKKTDFTETVIYVLLYENTSVCMQAKILSIFSKEKIISKKLSYFLATILYFIRMHIDQIVQ